MEDFLRIANRQRGPQRRVEERKYRSVGSDAERESQDGNGGEAGRFAQDAQTVAQILPARLHKKLPAASANDFLRNFETTAFQAHGAKRLRVAHPLLHLFGGLHLQVGAKLLLQLLVDL